MSKVEKLHIEYLLEKKTSLLVLSCSFSMLFVWVCVVMLFIIVFLFFTYSFLACCLGFRFFLDKYFFCNNPLVSCSFLTSLNLHGLFVCYCLLVLYLIISLAVISVFDFFVSLNIFLQQSTFP